MNVTQTVKKARKLKSQYWCLKSDMIPRWHLGSRFTKTLDFFFTQPLWNLTSPTYSQNRCKDTSTNP